MRTLYVGAWLLVTVGFGLFSLQTWQGTVRFYAAALAHDSHHLQQGVTATLQHQENMLYVLAERLHEADALNDPERGRRLIEHSMTLNPALAGFGLTRPDGQLVLVSGIGPEDDLPNLLDREASRSGFLAALDAPGMVVGRTYFFPLLQQWLIPVRLTYRNTQGEPLLVMTAGLRLDDKNALWNIIDRTSKARAVVWRDDGYRQLVFPPPSGSWNEAFDSPRGMPDNWPGLAGPGAQHPDEPAGLAHAERDDKFALTTVVGLASATLHKDFLRRMTMPSLLYVAVLAMGWVSFGYAAATQRRFENDLLHQATHDPLTQLPNRSLLEDRVRQDIARAKRADRHVAVMYVDLDQFKRVNDSFGHRMGDRLLRACAERLTNDLRIGDTVGRLGGDEFLLVFPDLPDPSHAHAMAARVLDDFNRAFFLGGMELFSTVSIGVAVYPHDGDDSETLLQNADAALYQAKDGGRNSFCFFEPAQNEATLRRIALEQGLRHALDRDELFLVYQPQCDTQTLDWHGAEALLRWRSAELGEVAPDEFIPVAEETGLIDTLGWFVLERAMLDAAVVQRRAPGFRFAVNVSVRQFHRADFIDQLLERLEAADMSPTTLELEVTESIMAESIPQLSQLRDAGIRLAIDDFGTGFSSLAYLKKLPVTTLKLDREFVADLESDPTDKTLVTAMVAVARELDLDTVAEGVETDGQLAILRSRGCTQVQGYFTGRPMPIDQLIRGLPAMG